MKIKCCESSQLGADWTGLTAMIQPIVTHHVGPVGDQRLHLGKCREKHALLLLLRSVCSSYWDKGRDTHEVLRNVTFCKSFEIEWVRLALTKRKGVNDLSFNICMCACICNMMASAASAKYIFVSLLYLLPLSCNFLPIYPIPLSPIHVGHSCFHHR